MRARCFAVIALFANGTLAQGLEIDAGVGYQQFVTGWSGFDNQIAEATLRPRWQSARLKIEGGVRVASQSDDAILGNLSVARVGLGEHLAVGRGEPVSTVLPTQISPRARLNQRVCATDFDCFSGGPIGLLADWKHVSFAVSAVAVPDLVARPRLDSMGRAHSRNRWASAPIQSVLFRETVMPLRNGTRLDQGLQVFLRPGARFEIRDEGRYGSWSMTSSIELSKQPTVSSERAIGFAPGPEAVATNEIALRYDYESVHSFAHSLRTSWGSFFHEYSGAFAEGRAQGSAVSGVERRWGSLSLSAFAGGVRIERWNPVVAAAAKFRLGAVALELRSSHLLRPGFGAWHLRPEVQWQFDRDLALYLQADFIRAAPDSPLFGAIRGNDRIVAGARYAF